MAAAYGIEGYCRDLTRLIGPDTPAEKCVEIARERCASMLKRGLDLRDEFKVVVPGQYSRNLVHRDPRGLFVVIALLWKPETASAIHDHTTWGVMGTYESAIECTNYDRVDDGSTPGMAQVREREVIPSGEGNVEIVLPPRVDIHRMRNPTKRRTITIHTYGREVDACNVYDPATCRMGTVSLRYANRPGEIPGASRIG
ncbi:MAG: cysteine dioxygenase family protein [Planctomycetaceae bacterium]|nr:cysteine dioxygenase family protein [Planctomycetota bacterium]NUN53198.1 cysteine dioxygenase family protein [Planctomycetaceae bacterium]